jgi:hypothetical protein
MAEYHITYFPGAIGSARTVVKRRLDSAGRAFRDVVFDMLIGGKALRDRPIGWTMHRQALDVVHEMRAGRTSGRVEYQGETVLIERVA